MMPLEGSKVSSWRRDEGSEMLCEVRLRLNLSWLGEKQVSFRRGKDRGMLATQVKRFELSCWRDKRSGMPYMTRPRSICPNLARYECLSGRIQDWRWLLMVLERSNLSCRRDERSKCLAR